MKRLIIIIILCTAFIFMSCRTISYTTKATAQRTILPPVGFSPSWDNIASGIDIFSFTGTNPRFFLSAIRIDLSFPERDIVISRGIEPMEEGEEGKSNFYSGTIHKFLRKENLVAAINATPFKPYRFFSGKEQTAVGIVLSKGVLYSNNSKYDALFITNEKKVFLEHPPFQLNDQVIAGAGGFFIILVNKENVAHSSPRDARSLAGTASGGRILFLAAIDGENTGTGSGATFYEAAEWMKALGAENALLLDGGSSSILALRQNPNDKIEILNHPDGGNFTWFQRNEPVFLGVK